MGIGREARAPAFELFPRDEEIVLLRARPKAAGGGRIRRALAAGVGPRVVFHLRLPGFKTKPLENRFETKTSAGFGDDNLRESRRKMVRKGSEGEIWV